MIKGTTPSLIFEADDSLNFEEIDNVHVTIKSVSTQLTKDLKDIDLDLDNHLIKLFLTQEETFELGTGDCKVQVRIHLKDETAMSTMPMMIRMDGSLEDEVIGAYE